MPKKKFIIGPAAKYCLLPKPHVGRATSTDHVWLRTDINVNFTPFAVDQDSELKEINIDARNQVPREQPCSFEQDNAEQIEVDEESYLRSIGTDPTAVFYGANYAIERTVHMQNPEVLTWPGLTDDASNELCLKSTASEVQEIASCFQVLDLSFSEENYSEDYDIFFRQIFEENKLPPPRSTSLELSRSTTLETDRKVGSCEDNLDKLKMLMKSYDDACGTQIPIPPLRCDPGVMVAISESIEAKELAHSPLLSRLNRAEHRECSTQLVEEYHQHVSVLNDDLISCIRSKWDCETMTSTFSSSHHRPRLLVSPGSRQREIQPLELTDSKLTTGREIESIAFEKVDAEISGSILTDYTVQNVVNAQHVTQGTPILVASESNLLWRQNIKRKGESKDVKHRRKAAVKAGRKQARSDKKRVKNFFKSEEETLKRVAKQATANFSVRSLT